MREHRSGEPLGQFRTDLSGFLFFRQEGIMYGVPGIRARLIALRSGFLQTPPRGDALAFSQYLVYSVSRQCWIHHTGDLHPISSRPCRAYTSAQTVAGHNTRPAGQAQSRCTKKEKELKDEKGWKVFPVG